MHITFNFPQSSPIRHGHVPFRLNSGDSISMMLTTPMRSGPIDALPTGAEAQRVSGIGVTVAMLEGGST
ncbi:hypothetical protein CJO78_06105 [Ralstonia solanacearum]|nr:hypothetical protein CJO78_06105 [Ralstonia solanacearum]AXW05419.1 hypothetical protein CJO82_05880 [Ralstonia solanacearum]AXW23160.1 hypothetical protein CJO86_05885 [Ralstonia solanacearum]AXW80092.1 hypothetical protein CJO98_06115 [Ralstonia solanacearum]